MADLLHKPLLDIEEQPRTSKKPPRAASLDVFRGLCVLLMMLVDYGGAIIPIIAHSPWNGLHLADSVMPFFLFIAGVSLAIVYKKVPNRIEATWKAVLRAIKLFLLGVVIQGGYFHGINSLTYGVDMKRIRWLGILQKISVGYLVAALCEIWLFMSSTERSMLSQEVLLARVKCSLRGDLGPACNSAGMIDRYVLGIDHLYKKPVYRNLKDHKGRMENWTLFSFSLHVVGLLLAVIGDPVNKSLYTISYTLITSASAGITYSALYLLVDVCGYRCLTFGLELMGKHSLIIFVLVTSNSAVISTQGFYWAAPENNMHTKDNAGHHIRIFLDDGNCELVSGPSLRARILVNVLKSTIITSVCPMDRPNDLNIRSLTRAFSDFDLPNKNDQ
ncbi:hypothetical protein OIU79_014612 [Salix purpurea]|uniref:Heparan-alpha-glucosaminide N-acetyltransferase catalytic domain-containing protein n=1 Tax=Salix purpurea TaxID=77065 RepID=A0A9Q0SX30_SALPP|nr:hypothetical protein OIU79_014612 [Salix purpurea]